MNISTRDMTPTQPTIRLTERQQLALALAESTRDCPADALMMNKTSSSSSDDDEEDDADDDDDDERKEQQKKKKKKKNTTRKASPNNAKQPQQPQAPMSRQQKELAKLAPWAWDPLVSRHAPGPSALRDFSEVLPSSEVKHKARVTMTPTASRPALKPTTVSLTGSAKNKKAEKEKENVAPSPTFSKNIGTTTAKKSSNTRNTKAHPSGGGAKRKAAENNPKMQGGGASVANNTNVVVTTKKARKNATTSGENVATSTKKEEEKLEKEKEAPATTVVTKKRSTIAGSRGKKDAAATATMAAEEPKTAPQKRTQKSEQITPVAFELEPASGTESKNLKKSAAAATATSDTVVPTTDAKGAQGKKALATTATPVVRAKKKLNLQTPGATVENNNETKAFVVDSAAVAEAKQTPLTKKRKKSNSPGSKTGAKETKVDPSALVPPEFQQRQLTPEERKERRDKFWVYLETIKVKPPKESAALLKEAMPSHRLYQSFCFATGRITRDVVKTTTTTIPTATTKGFVRVTSSSSLDEDALARRVRLVPMSRSLRMAVRALK